MLIFANVLRIAHRVGLSNEKVSDWFWSNDLLRLLSAFCFLLQIFLSFFSLFFRFLIDFPFVLLLWCKSISTAIKSTFGVSTRKAQFTSKERIFIKILCRQLISFSQVVEKYFQTLMFDNNSTIRFQPQSILDWRIFYFSDSLL